MQTGMSGPLGRHLNLFFAIWPRGKWGEVLKCRDELKTLLGDPMINLEQAHKVITAGEQEAKNQGQPMNIAVVDAGGNLVAFHRMDGAWLGSIDISIKKAWTSRAFDIDTKTLSTLTQPGKDFYG